MLISLGLDLKTGGLLLGLHYQAPSCLHVKLIVRNCSVSEM